MSKPKQQGSTATAVGVVVVLVITLSALGYYQFVYYPPLAKTTTSTSSGGCAPPSCVRVAIAFGAASLTDTAYAPDTVKLVIGVNNTLEFYNNDSQGGGVVHSATANDCPKNCPFDTGILNYGQNSTVFTITQPGTYSYHCTVHPTTMKGTVVVMAGKGGSTTPTASSSSGSSTSTTTSSSSVSS